MYIADTSSKPAQSPASSKKYRPIFSAQNDDNTNASTLSFQHIPIVEKLLPTVFKTTVPAYSVRFIIWTPNMYILWLYNFYSFSLNIGTGYFKRFLRIDSLCGIFSSGDKRKKKCEEISQLVGFKHSFSNIIYDVENAKIAEKKCSKHEPVIENKEYSNSLSGKNTAVKMFQCPFKNKDGSRQGGYYVCQGVDSNFFFFFHSDKSNLKKLIGYYSKTVGERLPKKAQPTVDDTLSPSEIHNPLNFSPHDPPNTEPKEWSLIQALKLIKIE